MVDIISQTEQKNKRYGLITSVIVHTLLIILALLPMVYFQNPPPEQEGILVNLGFPDQGQGDENAAPAESSRDVEPEEEEPEPQTEPEKPVERPQPQKPDPQPQKDIIKTEDPDAVALREQKKREQAEKAERDRQQREEETRQRAEAEAKRKAAEEEARKKAEADKLKGQIGGLFGGGKGKGNTGTSGNQGDPNGDPNAKALEGVSTGTGTVGGGLGDRGVASAPKIEDNSQQEGTVVVRVCVDQDGDVVEAEFTQRGSSISDARLKNIAVSNAKRWKFSKGAADKQCGTITYRFRVQ
ncbi:MAG: energy transducer TonB [Saprospiraceae bacterium]